MKIGDDDPRIKFGETDKDGDVQITIEIDSQQRKEFLFLSQEELKELIIHLQKQLRGSPDASTVR